MEQEPRKYLYPDKRGPHFRGRTLRVWSRRAILPALLVLLTMMLLTPGQAAVVAARPTLVHTQVVTPAQSGPLGSSSPVSSGSPIFRGHAPPAGTNYDEQLGMTFTQDFTSIEYNVTAVQQTDPTLGTGPGYLLSGVSNADFWYQVGLSWDWSPGIGFAMSYEVFNSLGNSIYPTNGGGGLLAFSGPINAGDNVTLNLYFNGSGQVVMQAQDTVTGANAQVMYSAAGSTYFVGNPTADANANGYFTGLMTEWYHGAPYYSNVQEVAYSSNFSLSSVWLWMDEFNANNFQIIFASNSTGLTTFSANPTQLQGLTYGSITEYCNALEFITGPLSGTSTTSSTSTTTTTTTATSTTTTTVSGTATTTTVTSTEIVTTTVPVTVTQTQTSTATTTVAQPVATTTTTVTSTQPTTVTTTQPTTVTSTQPTTVTDITTSTAPASTITTTQTVTQTAPATVGIPAWSYGLMVVLLLAGLALGYAAKRPTSGPAN
jgi:hypothetical protein